MRDGTGAVGYSDPFTVQSGSSNDWFVLHVPQAGQTRKTLTCERVPSPPNKKPAPVVRLVRRPNFKRNFRLLLLFLFGTVLFSFRFRLRLLSTRKQCQLQQQLDGDDRPFQFRLRPPFFFFVHFFFELAPPLFFVDWIGYDASEVRPKSRFRTPVVFHFCV